MAGCNDKLCPTDQCKRLAHHLDDFHARMRDSFCPVCNRSVHFETKKDGKAKVYHMTGLFDYSHVAGIGCGKCGHYWVPAWAPAELVEA